MPLSLDFWLIRGSALGPIGGLSVRQFNSCVPRREEKRREERPTVGQDVGKLFFTTLHCLSCISSYSLFPTLMSFGIYFEFFAHVFFSVLRKFVSFIPTVGLAKPAAKIKITIGIYHF